MLPANTSRKAVVEKTYQINRNIHKSPNPWLYSRQKKNNKSLCSPQKRVPQKVIKQRPKKDTIKILIPEIVGTVESKSIEPEIVDPVESEIVDLESIEPEIVDTVESEIVDLESIEPKIVDPVESEIVDIEIEPVEQEIVGYIGLAEERQNVFNTKQRQSVEFLKPLRSQKSTIFYSTDKGVTYITHNGDSNLYSTNSKLYSF